MSGRGAPRSPGPSPRRAPAPGFRLVIVATRWNADIVEGLLDGALRAAADLELDQPRVEYVDGALELPLAAARLAPAADALVALGAVIQGATAHFEHVCRASVDGLSRVSLEANVPLGNGVLTCATHAQAVERAGGPGSLEDKGYEATLAAVDLAGLRP